jgi:hypothetical protein
VGSVRDWITRVPDWLPGWIQGRARAESRWIPGRIRTGSRAGSRADLGLSRALDPRRGPGTDHEWSRAGSRTVSLAASETGSRRSLAGSRPGSRAEFVTGSRAQSRAGFATGSRAGCKPDPGLGFRLSRGLNPGRSRAESRAESWAGSELDRRLVARLAWVGLLRFTRRGDGDRWSGLCLGGGLHG